MSNNARYEINVLAMTKHLPHVPRGALISAVTEAVLQRAGRNVDYLPPRPPPPQEKDRWAREVHVEGRSTEIGSL